MKCNNCGTNNNSNSMFCVQCGQSLAQNNIPSNQYNSQPNPYNNNNGNASSKKPIILIAIVIVGILIMISGGLLTYLLISNNSNETTKREEKDGKEQEEQTNKDSKNIKAIDSIAGVWNCGTRAGSMGALTDGNPDHIVGGYTVTFTLNNDETFIWAMYENEEKNHVYGTTEVEELNKANNDYKYYSITVTGTEFVSNGVLQDEKYWSQYEMGLLEDNKSAVLWSITGSQYFCLLEK